MLLSNKTTLFVDIGNSSISWEIDNCYNSINIKKFLPSLIPQHCDSFISCVANCELVQYFTNPTIARVEPYQDLVFNYNLEQLGIDRFLGLVAGIEKHPKQDFMLVDIGTFVTIDIVQNNCHIDGGIASGLYQLQERKIFSGDDSRKSWELGTKNMLRDYIAQRCAVFKGRILITGGGQKIVNIEQGEYHQNLVITGLKVLDEK